MSNTAISALTEVASPALDAQEIPCNDAGTTKKIVLGTDLKPWIGRMLMNRSVADQGINSTTAYVAGSSISVPAGKLRAGTSFRWRIVATKDAGTGNANTFLLKIGTLGTTGDATIATLTGGNTTNAVDTAYFDFTATIRTITAGAATSHFGGTLRHNLATTGFAVIAGEAYGAAGSTFDSGTANLIVGLAFNVISTGNWTLVQVVAEAEAL